MKTREQKYWQEVLKTVKVGGFDALGHMDFPKRYYGEIYYEEATINEIFRNLLEEVGLQEVVYKQRQRCIVQKLGVSNGIVWKRKCL